MVQVQTPRHWLIQSSGLRRNDDMTLALVAGLEYSETEFNDFGVIPFTNEITGWEEFPTDGRSFFIHCSTKVLRIFNDPNIMPSEIFVGADPVQAMFLYGAFKAGLFYDEDAFNMATQLRVTTPYGMLSHYLLNGDACVFKLGDVLGRRFHGDRFIKPGKDLKLFSGGVLPGDQSLRELLEGQTVDASFERSMDELVIVAPIAELLAEWRFFVVQGCIVTQSQYRKRGALKWHSHVPEYVIDYAQHLATVYQPAHSFVMDLALTNDLDLKIVEYNCLNCSGFYHSSISELASALSEMIISG